MKPLAAYARIYREDDKAAEHFASIVSREAPAPSTTPDAIEGNEALRNEYLANTLKVGTTYSVTTEVSHVEPNGAARKAEERAFFCCWVRLTGDTARRACRRWPTLTRTWRASQVALSRLFGRLFGQILIPLQIFLAVCSCIRSQTPSGFDHRKSLIVNVGIGG